MMKWLQCRFRNRGVWGISVLSVGILLSQLVSVAQQASGQESTPEALNVYADAAGFQNGGQYDLAAEEWEKFLKQFASDPLFKKVQHYAGVCRLQLKDYEKAAGHFEQVVKDPKFEQVEDALLNLAWCQYSLGKNGQPKRFQQAIGTFTTLATKFPKGKFVDQALFYLGESQYAQDKKQEAVVAYKKLIDGHKKSTLRCDALYAMGVTLEELADYPQAGKVYDVYLKECASSPLVTEVRMRKAETILQAGDLAKAAKMFAAVAAVEGFAAADHAMFRQAYCAGQQQQFDEAGQLYARLATDFPQSGYAASAMISAGRSFYRGENPAAAEKWLQASIKAGGQDAAEAAHWLCRIYIQTGEHAKANTLAATMLPRANESEFFVDLKLDEADALYELAESRPSSLEKYLQIVADHAAHRLAPQSLYNAAFAALDLQRFDEGLTHANSFIAKYQDDVLLPDAKSVAAECSLHLAEFADAERLLRELAANYGEHAEIGNWKVRLGLVLYMQKKYGDVIASLSPALEGLTAAAQVAEAQFYIGASHFFEKRYDEAETAFAAARKADPKWRKSDEVELLMARSQRARSEFALARATIEQMLMNYPASKFVAEAYYRLGETCYAEGDYPAAAKVYAEVSTRSPESAFAPFAMYGKGWAHLKSLQYQEGATEFTALVTEHPKHELSPDAHFGRAMCKRQLSEYDAAMKDIEVYLKTDLKTAEKSNALYERGQCEAGKKDYASAVATFETLLKADPKYPNANGVLYEIGWALKNTNDEQKATAAFAKIVERYPDSSFAAEANYHVGESRYAKQEFKEAITWYSAAKQRSKVAELSEQASHKLAWTYFRLGQYEKSRAEFEEQLEKHARGKLAADAAFMRGECLFKSENYGEALSAFASARKSLPQSEAMQVLLLLHGGQSAAQLEDWPQAGEFLEAVPDKYPMSPLLAEVLFERGRVRQNLDRLDPALEDFNRAATLSRTAVGARSRFMIGEIEFQKKQYEAAITTFRKVMYGYGGEKAIKEIKPWQAVSGFEAGRCAETQIRGANAEARPKLIADAKKFYTFVVEKHPASEYAPKAKERLAELGRL